MFQCLNDQEASLGGTREHKKTDGAGGRKKLKQDSVKGTSSKGNNF